MGMYTRLTLFAEIDDEAAKVINSVLAGDQAPEHDWMWRPVACSSYYFHTQGTELYRDPQGFWRLNIDGSCKNYDLEIEQFMAWLHPHILYAQHGEFMGFKQYESDPTPDLIWYGEQRFIVTATQVPEGVGA